MKHFSLVLLFVISSCLTSFAANSYRVVSVDKGVFLKAKSGKLTAITPDMKLQDKNNISFSDGKWIKLEDLSSRRIYKYTEGEGVVCLSEIISTTQKKDLSLLQIMNGVDTEIFKSKPNSSAAMVWNNVASIERSTDVFSKQVAASLMEFVVKPVSNGEFSSDSSLSVSRVSDGDGTCHLTIQNNTGYSLYLNILCVDTSNSTVSLGLSFIKGGYNCLLHGNIILYPRSNIDLSAFSFPDMETIKLIAIGCMDSIDYQEVGSLLKAKTKYTPDVLCREKLLFSNQ